MSLIFWAAQTLAAYDLLGVEVCTVPIYSSHTAAKTKIIQSAYLHRYYQRYNAVTIIQVAYLHRYFQRSLAARTIQDAWFDFVSHPLDLKNG
jgi:hypothetical protein